jgi:hypothetical protein
MTGKGYSTGNAARVLDDVVSGEGFVQEGDPLSLGV